MKRRRLLATLASTGAAATAGCLDALSGSSNTHLGKPDDQPARSANLPFPAYGQALPEVTVPDPVAGEPVTTTQFEGRAVLATFFYSHCNTVCPFLISSLRSVQTAAANAGYDDEVVFLAVTFDPERDSAARLREYADLMHVDLDAGNWHFLRPETEARAKTVVEDTYGVTFEKTGATDSSMYMFNHLGLVVLANGDGYVERAYTGNDPRADRLRSDTEALLEKQS